MKKEKQKWFKYIVEVAPAQRFIRIVRVFLEGNNIEHLSTLRKREEVMKYPLHPDIQIPKEKIVVSRNHFDSKAFQQDDRFFSTESEQWIYSPSVIEKIKADELAYHNYNNHPIKL